MKSSASVIHEIVIRMPALLNPDPIRIRTNTVVFCDKKFEKNYRRNVYIFSLLQESRCIKKM